MKFIIYYSPLMIVLLLLLHDVAGQANKVSPKLDFDDTENKTNSDVPIIPGTGQGRQGGNVSGSETSGSRDGNASKDTKSSPKIHGVRVTVDTGDTQTSKEGKESVEITDVGKHKKRVGIHTDITFEISTDGDTNKNATSSEQDVDKEDASVPIYKGRNSDSGINTRKPNRDFPADRRSYDAGARPGPAYYYPQHYPSNVPVYVGSGDSRSSGSVYRHGDGWNTYVPNNNLWTTERSFNENYRPNAVTAPRSGNPSWKPCYCLTALVENRRSRANTQGAGSWLYHPPSTMTRIDNKLDKPFSSI